jgi:transcriptional regulator, gntR family
MNYNFDNNIPIYLQLVSLIKNDIIKGALSPGEKLPSIRDLAITYKVNPNTVGKALSELENISLIYTERTNGKYVSSDISLINKYKEEYAASLTEEYINKMINLGYNKEEVNKYIMKKGEKYGTIKM